jgi:hypothetical protein
MPSTTGSNPTAARNFNPATRSIIAMPNSDGTLTAKEQEVVEAFEQARPGYGEVATQNITSPYTGWAESIADMPPEAEIKVETGTASNSFMYRRIG